MGVSQVSLSTPAVLPPEFDVTRLTANALAENELIKMRWRDFTFPMRFANKGEKAVRLFDDFYPFKERGPNMIIKIWSQGNGKKGKRPTAWYLPSYQMERVANLMHFITLNPGEKHEVPVKDAYLLLTCLQPLASGKIYELEVRFRDGYGDPGTRREYVGKKDFIVIDQTPR